MALEIHAIIGIVATLRSAIQLRRDCRHNKKKSESLIKCLEAVKAPLDAIVEANHDRVQVSHEATLRPLQDVIDQAEALLKKQTQSQGTVTKALNSSRVRDEFHEIQIALEMHMGALNVSLGVLSGLKIQEGLDIIKQENQEALQEHLSAIHDGQGVMQGNQRNMLSNQNAMQDNQRQMLDLLASVQGQLTMSSNAINNNTYNITNDHSTTTTNNINNVTKNYQQQTSNVLDSEYRLIPKKPENYVKRKTKLHMAAEKGSLSEVKEALRTVFIDHENQNGSTALLLAVENKHGEVIEYLLLEGVDFQMSANKKSWRKVIERKEQSNIGYFIEAGILQVNIEFEDGWTPLHWCAQKGNLVIARALIDAKADVNAKEKDGWTPLHWCAEEGHLEFAQALIDAKADVNAKDNDGRTPLYRCAQEGHLDIARALINAGSNFDGLSTEQVTDLLRKISGLGTK